MGEQSIIVEHARQYATHAHHVVNHKYDGLPYHHHLKMVYDTALQYIELLPEADRTNALCACWAHDVIEDCRQIYNDVKEVLGKDVAEIVYNLTNEKGRNRKERANAKYYAEISAHLPSAFVKICDRIANTEHSLNTNSKMVEVYRKENVQFIRALHRRELMQMLLYLSHLTEQPISTEPK